MAEKLLNTGGRKMAILINMLDLLKPENRRKTLELSRNEGKSVEMFALHLLESYVEGKLEWVEEEEDPEVIIESDRLEDMELSIDRKSTRLNSSHVAISYAVFCLKK